MVPRACGGEHLAVDDKAISFVNCVAEDVTEVSIRVLSLLRSAPNTRVAFDCTEGFRAIVWRETANFCVVLCVVGRARRRQRAHPDPLHLYSARRVDLLYGGLVSCRIAPTIRRKCGILLQGDLSFWYALKLTNSVNIKLLFWEILGTNSEITASIRHAATYRAITMYFYTWKSEAQVVYDRVYRMTSLVVQSDH